MDSRNRTPGGKLRARGLGIAFDGEPGEHCAITDVPGVQVGYATLIRGEGPLVRGRGPVRTGVTAILPRGGGAPGAGVFAGGFSLNGNGELTGLHWVEESGVAEGPITITNTHSCGLARDATIRWLVERVGDSSGWVLPIAGETYDGDLNDINGFHVGVENVFAALDGARGGPLELGSVGGGTGMICYQFKGGSGSASRLCEIGGARYCTGVFVQANFGRRAELMVRGVPVGKHAPGAEERSRPGGSIIAVVATDAPLLPHQLKRLARRVSLGVARTGSVSHNGSGDLFLAFSTANVNATASLEPVARAEFLGNESMDPLFTAVVEATEEAIIDAMVANEDMTGRDGHTVEALPHERLMEVYRRYRGPGS
jgi:L-aminopeptidase/D-esterase-like protein